MAGGNISSEKIDLLIYGPSKPIVDNGFSDQFVLHSFETIADLERLTPAAADKNPRRRRLPTIRCAATVRRWRVFRNWRSSPRSASATTTSTPITRATTISSSPIPLTS